MVDYDQAQSHRMDKAKAQICLWQQQQQHLIKFDITPEYVLASGVWMSEEKGISSINIDVL